MYKIASAHMVDGIDKMAKFFNKNLNDEQKEIWTEKLMYRCSSKEVFEDTLDAVIEKNRYMPTIREFIVAHASIMAKQLRISGKSLLSNCLLCNGYGVVTCIKNEAEVAMACKCKAGDKVDLIKYNGHPLRDDPDMVLTEKEEAVYKALKTYFPIDKTVNELQKRLA